MATNYYVSKDGSDSNPGTFLLPWLTIAEGVQRLEDGDTLFILEGEYEERFTFTDVEVSQAKFLSSKKMVAYPGDEVILTADESRTLGYFYLQGSTPVQDPANYAGVTLCEVATQRDNGEPIV